jgi:uncharacterized Rmd1/YagE family protein
MSNSSPPTGPAPTTTVGPTRARLSAHAYALGERIDTRGLVGERSLSGCIPLSTRQGTALVFRFGCVVFFNTPREQHEDLLTQLKPNLVDPFKDVAEETAEFSSATGEPTRVAEDGLVLGSQDLETLYTIGDVLAKSVALEYYERRIATAFDNLEPLTLALATTGVTQERSKTLIQHIALGLLAEHRLTGRVEVAEKPDLLWDRADLERVHTWLVREYEIKDRQLALERKLALVSRTAQVLLDLLNVRRSLRVEWYIVFLIIVEVVLMLVLRE